MKLDPSHFDHWFRALYDFKPDQDPFPWQRRLFRHWLCPPNPADARWPNLLKLPTASGKTSIIDLAVLALAAGSPCARRRIALVVDRRLVVDEAASRAHRIADRLQRALAAPNDPLYEVAQALLSLGGDQPLIVATLRGGITPDDGWARSPAQPAVVLSTVDQVGSRLLFRAYGGHGPRSWPIHAGLLGRDTLLIIDEAHCAAPFCDTARAIADHWQHFAHHPVGATLSLVRMSATPGELPDFQLDDLDRNHPVLLRRLRAPKPAQLLLVNATRKNSRAQLTRTIIDSAHNLLRSMTSGVLAIVLNRVADARTVFESLNLPSERKLLLTGRVRGWERDRLLDKWLPKLRAGSRQESEAPLALVATQCIEVGANFDFDYLITEIAPLDALRQRFGRLDRLGHRALRLSHLGASLPAIIVASAPQIERDEAGAAISPDPIYGHALARTWAWLNDRANGDPLRIDFAIDALEPLLPEGDALQSLCLDVASAFPLLPAHLDLLAQTSPPPQPEPDISAFLHGTTRTSPEITLVWRSDLPEADPSVWPHRVAVQPPVTGEGCPVPIWEFRRWLATLPSAVSEDSGDLETRPAEPEALPTHKPVLRWRGADDAHPVNPADIIPGDTVVLPSTYGGCDDFGWNPASPHPVSDLGDAAALTAQRRPVLRLDCLRTLLSSLGAGSANTILQDLAKWAADDEDAPNLTETLVRLASIPGLPDWLRSLSHRLASDRRCRAVDAAGAWAIVGRRGSDEDLTTAADGYSRGVPVRLSDHSRGVQDYAGRFARALGLDPPLASDIQLAAWLHDVGKADPRFQLWLHRGDQLAAALADAPLAKSAENPRNWTAIRRARSLARYPEHARHEVQSLALITGHHPIQAQASDWDLVQHLVVAHHGFARPFLPPSDDPEPVLVALDHGPFRLAHSSDHLLHRIDSGVADRYWRLLSRYGWWGLAWLEAILRLADQRRSEHEQLQEADND